MNGRALAAEPLDFSCRRFVSVAETTFHWSVRLSWYVVVAEFACALHRG